MKKLAISAVVSAVFLATGLVSAQVNATKKAEAPRAALKVEVKAAVVVDQAKPAEKVAEKAAVAPMIRLAPARRVGLAPALAQPPGEADLEPLRKQLIQNARPMFRAELRFLTSTCDPSPEQRREIAIEGGKALKDAVKKLAEIQHALQNGGWRGGVIPDARKMLRDGMEAAAKTRLSPDQFARYEAELGKRTHDQRQAIALNLVANMDRLLILSPEQRDKLVESLMEHWDERVFPSLENVINYEQYFPNIPDQHITPHLNEAQQKAWQGAQKVTFGQSFAFNFNNNGVVNGPDPDDQDEDVKAALAEEVKTP